MYRMYKGKCQESNMKPVSLFVFRYIFNTKFNLHFHKIVMDTFQKCDGYKAKIDALEDGQAKEALITEQALHHRKAEAAKNKKIKNIEEAKQSNGTKAVLTFDLQKTLPTPVLSTGIAYYKRQLWSYNLGIHDDLTGIGYMYVWSEDVASRGPQEIASCLKEHFEQNLPNTTKEVTLYSDSCGGQNRNIKMPVMLSKILQSHPSLEVINQNFFIPRHSFSTCNQNFGIIEKEKRYHKNIYLPDDWIEVIQASKKKAPKFVVTKMDSSKFFSCAELLKNEITNRNMSVDNHKVEWLKMQFIHIRKTDPKKLYVKYTVDEGLAEFIIVDLTKLRRGRRTSGFKHDFTPLYPTGRKITKEKSPIWWTYLITFLLFFMTFTQIWLQSTMQTIAHKHVILVKMLCTNSLLQNYMTIFANVIILVTTLCVVLTYCILSFLMSCAKDAY